MLTAQGANSWVTRMSVEEAHSIAHCLALLMRLSIARNMGESGAIFFVTPFAAWAIVFFKKSI